MTVNELIAKLNEIEDKDKMVKVHSAGYDLNVLDIYENINNVHFKLEPIELDWEDCL